MLHRQIDDKPGFERWKEDINDWFRRTNEFLSAKLSSADAAIFRDLSEGASYGPPGDLRRFSDRAPYTESLRKYAANLKAITLRYLGKPS